MSVRAANHPADVVSKEVLSAELVRLRLRAPEFRTTGVPDEWVALTAPGQFQTRYYTVRAIEADLLTIDVVIHEHGLVTEWAQTECVGDEVTLSAPKGSYLPPEDAQWVVLAADLTGLPAVARILETEPRPVLAYVEAPVGTEEAYPLSAPVTWLPAPASGSELAKTVEEIDFAATPGYFWMAGESAQMRDVRRWSRGRFDAKHMTAMGYWSGARGRQTRAMDPGPIYARGRAAGKSDAEIWADYDEARS